MVSRSMEAIETIDLLTIVRAFLRERVPRPPLPAILGVIAEDRRFRDPAERPRFAEHVREGLASHWVPAVVDGLRGLGEPSWIRLSPDAEEELSDHTVVGAKGITLRMSPALRKQWIDALRDTGEDSDGGPEAPQPSPRPLVLLTTPRARPAAIALLEGTTPHVPVLSTTELQRSAVEPVPATRWLDPPMTA